MKHFAVLGARCWILITWMMFVRSVIGGIGMSKTFFLTSRGDLIVIVGDSEVDYKEANVEVENDRTHL